MCTLRETILAKKGIKTGRSTYINYISSSPVHTGSHLNIISILPVQRHNATRDSGCTWLDDRQQPATALRRSGPPPASPTSDGPSTTSKRLAGSHLCDLHLHSNLAGNDRDLDNMPDYRPELAFTSCHRRIPHYYIRSNHCQPLRS